jgi:hypothetical protein
MGKVSLFCVLLVFALLLEDGSSVKKKTEDEKKEDEELAKAVNRTLAEEEKRREEDEKKKRTEDETQGKKKQDKDVEKQVVLKEGQNEAGPSYNCTCPLVETCKPCEPGVDCPVANCTRQGGICPEIKPCPICKVCADRECDPCPEIKDCRPCAPCPALNRTSLDVECPAPPVCPGDPGLSLPAAMAVGAVTGVLVNGIAAAVGLILRYVSPIVSGFLFLATIIIVWYLCSQYPETARELGGRAANLLREAAVALGHRVMVAIQRHQDQVGFSNKPYLFLRLSSIFHLE